MVLTQALALRPRLSPSWMHGKVAWLGRDSIGASLVREDGASVGDTRMEPEAAW